MDWATERTGGCVSGFVMSFGVENCSADRMNRELCARDLISRLAIE